MLCGLLIKAYLAQNRMGGGSPQAFLLNAADLSLIADWKGSDYIAWLTLE